MHNPEAQAIAHGSLLLRRHSRDIRTDERLTAGVNCALQGGLEYAGVSS